MSVLWLRLGVYVDYLNRSGKGSVCCNCLWYNIFTLCYTESRCSHAMRCFSSFYHLPYTINANTANAATTSIPTLGAPTSLAALFAAEAAAAGTINVGS